MHLVVGLGNPGDKYERTRHNVGFLAVDYLAWLYNIQLNKIKHKAIIGEGLIQNNKVIIVKPQTYMNNSGQSIKEIVNWYKINKNNIIVIYDDISLKTGKLRIRPKGSDGGHNGIKSIIYNLNSDVFPRIKIGIGQPSNSQYDLADYVLGKFTQDEHETIMDAVKKAADAVSVILQAGIDVSMNKFNGN